MVGFGTAIVAFGEVTLLVAVADTPALRNRGLREVTDLGNLDGMVFVFDEAVPVWFTMEDTLVPLDLLVVSEDSQVVRRIAMVPCESTPCPLYPTEQAAAYAVEVPAGAFPEITPGRRFSIKQAGIGADG